MGKNGGMVTERLQARSSRIKEDRHTPKNLLTQKQCFVCSACDSKESTRERVE
jgi:hypothetical protein